MKHRFENLKKLIDASSEATETFLKNETRDNLTRMMKLTDMAVDAIKTYSDEMRKNIEVMRNIVESKQKENDDQ
jgi:glucose-6-phosphate isomerase